MHTILLMFSTAAVILVGAFGDPGGGLGEADAQALETDAPDAGDDGDTDPGAAGEPGAD